MFTEKTQQGYEIISTLKLVGATHIVFKRGENNFGWGSYYNEETGSWAQGHYDYSDPNLALEDMLGFATDRTLIPQGEKSFKEELKGFAESLAEQNMLYNETPLDNEEEFFEEFYRKEYQDFIEGFDIYKESYEKLTSTD